jgi:branched-chain amino acid transport system permease protein
VDFFWLLLVNGVLVGMLYSLIALGFILIYKATDAINFAQGEMVMISGFLLAGILKVAGGSLIVAILVCLAVMVLFGFGIERVMLRPLLGRPVIAVIMATIGLASVLKGLGPIFWGAETKNIPLPIRDEPIPFFGLPIAPVSLVAAAVSLVFLGAFALFFLRSRAGIAMRAMADDQPAAMAMGINVGRYFGLAWALAGIVSAAGGVIWGSLLGVDVHLALVGLKVFPVIILGGIESIPGAVVGGLIVGVVESVSAGYIDPYVGGGTKDFVPYLLMIVALMIRPHGIFGEEIIERV